MEVPTNATDIQVRNLKPKDRPYKVGDGRGLFLHITVQGTRTWRYQYRFDGKQKTLYLGGYPAVSIAQAREMLQEARELLAAGGDPAAEKAKVARTFEVVARKWFEHWSEGRHERHAQYVLRRLELDVFPYFGSRPIAEIPASAFRDAVRRVEARGAMDIAKRLLQTCGTDPSLRGRERPGEQQSNCGHQAARHSQTSQEAALHTDRCAELPALLKAIDGYPGNEHTRLALQFMALTFVGTNELIGARWQEIDFAAARWNIPAERMKMRTPHSVPLSTQAIAVLERLKQICFGRELVFPGDIWPRRPMSNNTLLYALYRLGYRGRMTGRGFRGVASTILQSKGGRTSTLRFSSRIKSETRSVQHITMRCN